ncbi:McrB family protein [Caldalkalibacillus thermarum]|uniref:McrB family protein n=1 Tax=Caldalkalibacillus thermarum TaxID=296745 RepID=UPI00166DCF30|nr:AAA family ATPase [Caldalkalibacillus thermarum]
MSAQQDLHLVLKYNNATFNIDTIKEHQQIIKQHGKVIWGIIKPTPDSPGVGKDKFQKIKDQVRNRIETYAFFVMNSTYKAVGKIADLLTKEEVRDQKHLVPAYYRDDTLDRCVAGVVIESIEPLENEKQVKEALIRYGTQDGEVALNNQTNPLYVSMKYPLTFHKVITDIPDESIRSIVGATQKYIASKGFYYTGRLIENFYLSLRTKPFVILAGISGTGKTKLVKLFAEALGATEENGQYTLIPVRPDWSDPSDLLGYVDLQGTFRPGPLTKVIQRALQPENRDKPYFVCLDEMNLARVEHYFSDLLSVMESRRWDDEQSGTITTTELDLGHHSQADPSHDRLYIPDNLYIIGTVNMDETTHPFSKKVLDRANTIELNEVNLAESLSFYHQTAEDEVAEEGPTTRYGNPFLRADYLILQDAFSSETASLIRRVVEKLDGINQILAQAHLQIGFRVRDEILFYMLYNDRFQLMPEQEALDFQIMQKILPRIQGSSMNIKRILVELFNRLGNTNLSEQDHGLYDEMKLRVEANPPYRRSLSKLAEMVRRFEEDGFTSFWMA